MEKIIEMVVDTPTMDNLGDKYGASGKVEVLLVVSELDVDRKEKAKLVKMILIIKEGDMRCSPGKSDSRTVEAFKEKEINIKRYQ